MPALVLLALVIPEIAECQSGTAPNGSPASVVNGGFADVALQGYYLGGNSQGVTALSGTAISFRDYFPQIGLISGNLEGYEQNTQGKLGDNYLELKGFLWNDRRWNVTGGDFRVPANPVTFPFQNYFSPLIGLRGAEVEMSDGRRAYTLFWGVETLTAGARVGFRISVPQQVLGGSVKQTVGHLEVSARYLHLSSPDDAPDRFPQYFSANRSFREADILTVAAYHSLTSRLKLYSDATLSRTERIPGLDPVADVPLSWVSGLVWDGPKLTIRANYGSQSTSYLPVLGYYAGDRRGPFAEAHYKLFKGLDVYGSGMQSRNNLENNPAVPTLTLTGVSGGASAALPWHMSLGGEFSSYNILTANPPALGGDQLSKNSQYSASLSKAIAHHSFALSLRELDLNSPSYRQKQNTAEFGDTFQFSRFSAGTALRFQQTNTGQLSNSLFFRGNLQAHFGPVNAYVQAEIGNDLINKSVFATNTVNTTVAGVNVRGLWGWSLQAEVFRNSLTAALNPENIFILETRGQGVSTVLSDLNQWSAYIRLNKRFKWGPPLPDETDRFIHDQRPLVGTIVGFVRETGANGLGGVAEVPVVLDGSRTVLTDVLGGFTFSDVAEGRHRIALSPTELPAQFSYGEHASLPVGVRARKTARGDLDVIRLASRIEGQVSGATELDGLELDRIVLMLAPGSRETTCDSKGHFGFFNLPAGEYRLTLDATTLPENYVLVSPGVVKMTITNDAPGAAHFAIERHDPKLPVRKVFGGQPNPQ
jgi:hypothetical protein